MSNLQRASTTLVVAAVCLLICFWSVGEGAEVSTHHQSFAPSTATLPPIGGTSPTPLSAATADFGFEGLSQVQGRTAPPDPHIAAGPNHVVQVVNGAIGFFDRQGRRTFWRPSKEPNGFWSEVWGSIPPTADPFDPEVVWDPFSNRFIAVIIVSDWINRTAYALLAISDDEDPNGTWHKYAIDVTVPGGTQSIDQPSLGVDDKVVYFSVQNLIPSGIHVVLLDKAPLLSGLPPTVRTVVRPPPFVWPGLQFPVLHGALPPDPYTIEIAPGNAGLRLGVIIDPLGSPQIQNIDIPIPQYTFSVPAPSRGSPNTVRTHSGLLSPVWRNGSLWLAHALDIGGPRNIVRWYEVATNGWPQSGRMPRLVQMGDVDNGPGVHTFMGAIAVDGANNAILCYAQSSLQEFFSIRRSHRLATDAPGTMRPPQTIQTSTGRYTGLRWGDYGAVVQDPTDPGAMWYTHVYAVGNAWRTWIGKMQMQDWLGASSTTLSASAGGTLEMRFENSAQAGRAYVLLGSLSGTSPGTRLAPSVQLPLNFDPFTVSVLGAVGTPAFQGFLGVLDSQGQAVARLTLPAGLGPLQGLTMNYAAAIATGPMLQSIGFASNAVTVTLSP